MKCRLLEYRTSIDGTELQIITPYKSSTEALKVIDAAMESSIADGFDAWESNETGVTYWFVEYKECFKMYTLLFD